MGFNGGALIWFRSKAWSTSSSISPITALQVGGGGKEERANEWGGGGKWGHKREAVGKLQAWQTGQQQMMHRVFGDALSYVSC